MLAAGRSAVIRVSGGLLCKAAILRLDRLPPTLLVLLAVISIQLGSALAITLFPLYGPLGMLFLRMAIGGACLCILYRASLARALRQAPLGHLAARHGHDGAELLRGAGAHCPGIAVSIEFLGPLGGALATSRRLVDMAACCWPPPASPC